MNETEAIEKIESWLQIPIDFTEILPALAVLRQTFHFDYYAKRVAEAEYSNPEKIAHEVDEYLAAHPIQASSFEEKLARISGRSDRFGEPVLNNNEADILDDLEQERHDRIYGPSDKQKLNNAFQNYASKNLTNRSYPKTAQEYSPRQGYSNPQDYPMDRPNGQPFRSNNQSYQQKNESAPKCFCPNCGLPIYGKGEFTTSTIVLTVILFLFFNIFALLILLFAKRKYTCPSCGMTHYR